MILEEFLLQAMKAIWTGFCTALGAGIGTYFLVNHAFHKLEKVPAVKEKLKELMVKKK